MRRSNAGVLAGRDTELRILREALLAARSQTVVPPKLTTGLVDQIRLRADRSGPCSRSGKRKCCTAFARGQSIPDIAKELYLSASTVKMIILSQ